MKYFVVIVLFSVGIFVGICDAACEQALAPETLDPRGCNYGGEFHKFGSSWKTNTCKKCDCYPDGAMGCCDIGGYPGNYDKEKCKIIYDKDHCPITVVRKDDPRKTCPHSMVG